MAEAVRNPCGGAPPARHRLLCGRQGPL